MIPLPEFYRPKRVYRVRSLHQMSFSKGKTYVRTRHFFTKFNAERSYANLLKSKNAGKVVGTWGKVLDVEFRESEPLVFREDELQAEGGLDTCQADA